MIRLLVLAIGLGVAGPAMALGPATYECTVTSFADDSRYPLNDLEIRRAEGMDVVITDRGYEVVVETTYPGAEPERATLPVTQRQIESFVASITSADGEHTVGLAETGEPDAPFTGTLVYRTYETGHLWTFTCVVRI